MDADHQEPLTHSSATLFEHTFSGFHFACGLYNIPVRLSRPSISPLVEVPLLILYPLPRSYARNLFVPPAEFGIGTPTPVRSIPEALAGVTGGRNKVVFVNNGFAGGDIDRVIAQVAEPVRDNGMFVEILSSDAELTDACRSTLQGTSACVVSAVFFSSPEEGQQGQWNYTIKADMALGGMKIRTDKTDNDAQLYILPFQHAIDWAIASNNETTSDSLPEQVSQRWTFSSLGLDTDYTFFDIRSWSIPLPRKRPKNDPMIFG